jgi:hypothetical protein
MGTAYCYSERIACRDISTIVSGDEELQVEHSFIISAKQGQQINFYVYSEEEKRDWMTRIGRAAISKETFIDYGEESNLN